MDIDGWLDGLGLSQYAEAFAKNDIDLDILPSLTSSDLAEIGISSVGHRRRLLNAIAALDDASSSAFGEPAPAERRQITVLFCDMVGSTAIAERLDAEDMAEVISSYHEVCKTVLSRHDAYLANFMGDGVMAYFGYPRAREDDAERALLAAMELLEAIPHLRTPAGPGIKGRIGIDTGIVVVGDIAKETVHGDLSAVGKTSNRAARIQSFASPDEVLISEATRRLCPAAFEFADRGTHAFKGVSVPTKVWQVMSVGQGGNGPAIALTPFVGRQTELDHLLELWITAETGKGQTALIKGDPGMGKSRLVRALREQLSQTAYLAYEFEGTPYFSGTAYHTLVQELARWAKIERGDDIDVQRLKLLQALELNDHQEGDLQHSFVDQVLQVLNAGSAQLGAGQPDASQSGAFKTWLFDHLTKRLVSENNETASLVILDNAQWVDPSSLEFFQTLQQGAGLGRLLFITVARPGWNPPWQDDETTHHIPLHRLTPQYMLNLIEAIDGAQNLSTEVKQQIADRSDGVPLYLEEVTRSVLENIDSGDGASSKPGDQAGEQVPSTLLEALMARLDSLDQAKSVALTAACIGRDFSLSLLEAVSQQSTDDLELAVQKLVAADLVRPQSASDAENFSFRHKLVQETAYQVLLRPNRRDIHARIAAALENQNSAQQISTAPQVTAFHYEQAAMPADAARLWYQVGESQIGIGGYVEALNALEQARSQIDTFQFKTASLTRLELKVLAALGSVLIAVRPQASSEIGTVYEQAYVISRNVGAVPETGPVLFGLAVYFFFRGELSRTENLCDQLIELSQKLNDPTIAPGALLMRNQTRFWLGKHEQMQRSVRETPALNAAPHPKSSEEEVNSTARQMARYAQDPYVTARITYVWSLNMIGQFDLAETECAGAMDYAKALDHPYSIAQAHQIEAWHHSLRNDPHQAFAAARDMLKLSREQGFMMLLDIGHVLQYWAMGRLEKIADAAEKIDEIITRWCNTGAHLAVNATTALLADIALREQKNQLAQTALDRALETGRTGDVCYHAELTRLKACTAMALGKDSKKILHLFDEAVDTARQQGAHLFALRAANDRAAFSSVKNLTAHGEHLVQLKAIAEPFRGTKNNKDVEQARRLIAGEPVNDSYAGEEKADV